MKNNRRATAIDFSAIKRLCIEVFGDSEDYINRFITHFGIENCYVCENNHEIIAMAFAIPADLSIYEVQEFKNSKYIYACATHPDFRGQGIMSKLLETIFEECCNEDVAAIFLFAADDSLAKYYRKLGFEDFFHRTSQTSHLTPPSVSERSRSTAHHIPHTLYHNKRVQKLENSCFVNWNEDFFRFLSETGTKFCEFENTIFSFRTEINKLIVDEFLGDAPKEQITNLLFKHHPNFDVVHIRTQGDDFCCGQIKWCNPPDNKPENGWFAFAME